MDLVNLIPQKSASVTVKSVTISYPERAPADYTPTVYVEPSFEKAITRLLKLSHVARKNGIHRADVVVEWEDGFRHHLKHPVGQPITAGMLRENVWRYFALYAGFYCPPTTSMEAHRAVLPAAQREKYTQLLATHEIYSP